MNKRRGYYIIELNGKKYTMHFSMNFWANFTEALGIPIDKIGDLFNDGSANIGAIRDLVYSAILADHQETGKEITFNKFQVGMWMEDVDAQEIAKIMEAMMESRILGNDMNGGIKRNVKQTTNSKKKS